MTRNIIKHGKSCQDLALLHDKKISRYVRTCMIFAWLSRNKIFQNFLCVKNFQDLNKLRKENFLTCLDKILSRSYQGVPRNICVSRSWQDISSFARVIKILHFMVRCIKFCFTGLMQRTLKYLN